MNLNHLKYLVDAADLQSCSASAKKNHISQPALSQSIKNLEQELGYEILNHRPKSFELTEKGKQFLNYARDILDLAHRAKTEINQESIEVHPVHIVCTHSFFRYYLKQILPVLRQKCPNWEISISFGDRSKIKQNLDDGSSDIGFMISQEGLSQYDVQKVSRGHFFEISSNKVESNEQLLYVTSLKDKEVRKGITDKSKYKKIVEIGSWESIYEMVTSQFGRGIVPDYIIRDSDIHKKKLDEYDLVMIEKKRKNLPTKKFSEVLYQELRKL